MLSFLRARPALTCALLAVLFFMPGLGAVHLFDWDEINFAEIAREMLASGNWLQPRIDHQPFHEKPPFFIWLQAASMSLFGVNEFAARLPNALCGALTLLVLFRIGRRLRDERFGALWALAYFGSLLPHLYFRSGIIDPWFNLFIFLGLMDAIRASDAPASNGTYDDGRDRAALRAGAWLGLAVLTKGPVGVLIPALCAATYFVLQRFRLFISVRRLGLLLLTLIGVPAIWFGIDLLRNGPEFMVAFFWRQMAMLTTEDAGHGGFFGYHVVVLLVGCFPASVFALLELVRPTRGDATQSDRRRWMVILFWVVLVLFSIVRTKIVHYSSLCYFPLTYLAALQLDKLWQGGAAPMWSRVLLGGIGSLFAAVTLAVPFLGMHMDLVEPLVAGDAFALANLDADVHWTGLEALAGLWMCGVLAFGHFYFSRARYRQGIIAVFGGMAVFITLTLFFFINNIEGYTQRAAVEFFEARQGERCWLMTYGYKSYVPPFYGRTTEARPAEAMLISGPIDRPVYLSCKVTDTDEVEALGTFTELYRRNGFVFYERRP